MSKCETNICTNEATERAFWPGRKPINVCQPCARKLNSAADVIGFSLTIEAIQPQQTPPSYAFPPLGPAFNTVNFFHTICGLTTYDRDRVPMLPGAHKPYKRGPTVCTGTELREMRRRLMAEEWQEYEDAEASDDLVEIADALADLIFIAMGTAIEYGIPLPEIFKEVCDTNEAKVPPGGPTYREDGKILKPEGWKPPDVAGILRQFGWRP